MAKNTEKNSKEYNKAARAKYKKENFKRVPLDIPVDEFQMIDNHIQKTKESRSGFIRRAIKETIKKDAEIEN